MSDLPRSRATAEPVVKPLAAQRQRAEALLASFGIGPSYHLTYAEALNAMTLFALNEQRGDRS